MSEPTYNIWVRDGEVWLLMESGLARDEAAEHCQQYFDMNLTGAEYIALPDGEMPVGPPVGAP